MDLTTTKQLKALAIIFVIIGHLNQSNQLFLPHSLLYIAAWGVSIFAFLSGYGLVASYLKNGLKNFFFKRITKILIPYSLVTFVWIIIDTLINGKSYSIFTIVLSLIGLDMNESVDKSMWYITFILLWYVIFYLVFNLKIKNIYKVILLYFLALVFTPSSGGTYQFLFPTGCLFGLYVDKIKNFKYLWLVGLSFLVMFLFTMNLYDVLSIYYFANNMISTFWIIPLVMSLKLNSVILKFIGSISFEIYMFESAFMLKYRLFLFNNRLISILFYSLIVLTLSYFLSIIIKRIKLYNKTEISLTN